MKGAVLVFLAMAFCSVGWRYCSKQTRREAMAVVRNNLISFLLAAMTVAVVVFFSLNTNIKVI